MRNMAIKTPDIKRIFFNYLPQDNSHISDFMTHCFPDNLQLFTFGWNGSRFSIDYYSSALKHALPKVTKEVYIYNKILSQ
jgi:hypothetical protein